MRRLHDRRVLEMIRQLLLLLLLLLVVVEGLRIVVLGLQRTYLMILIVVVAGLLLKLTWLWHLGLWLQRFVHSVTCVYPL